MCMESQGGNSIHNLPHIADFRLKCCILKEDTKNNISGRTQHSTKIKHPHIPRSQPQQTNVEYVITRIHEPFNSIL